MIEKTKFGQELMDHIHVQVGRDDFIINAKMSCILAWGFLSCVAAALWHHSTCLHKTGSDSSSLRRLARDVPARTQLATAIWRYGCHMEKVKQDLPIKIASLEGLETIFNWWFHLIRKVACFRGICHYKDGPGPGSSPLHISPPPMPIFHQFKPTLRP